MLNRLFSFPWIFRNFLLYALHGLPLLFFWTAAVRRMATMLIGSQQTLQEVELLFVLPRYSDREGLQMEDLLLAFLLHKHLLDLTLLLLSDLHHNLLNSGVHLFLVLVSADRLGIHPRMLHDVVERYALLGVSVQHFLD